MGIEHLSETDKETGDSGKHKRIEPEQGLK